MHAYIHTYIQPHTQVGWNVHAMLAQNGLNKFDESTFADTYSTPIIKGSDFDARAKNAEKMASDILVRCGRIVS